MRELKIDPEFRDLIFDLTDDERIALEESIIKEGCRDALVCWNDIILDGHNRYSICCKHNKEFEVIQKDFEDKNAAKIWMIDNQRARRNLAPQQLKYLWGMRYELEKKATNGFGDRNLSDGQNDQRGTTAEHIAYEK